MPSRLIKFVTLALLPIIVALGGWGIIASATTAKEEQWRQIPDLLSSSNIPNAQIFSEGCISFVVMCDSNECRDLELIATGGWTGGPLDVHNKVDGIDIHCTNSTLQVDTRVGWGPLAQLVFSTRKCSNMRLSCVLDYTKIVPGGADSFIPLHLSTICYEGAKVPQIYSGLHSSCLHTI